MFKCNLGEEGADFGMVLEDLGMSEEAKTLLGTLKLEDIKIRGAFNE
jgi:hypothetical protein